MNARHGIDDDEDEDFFVASFMMNEMLESSSSDEDDMPRPHGGSLPGKSPNIDRKISDGGGRIYDDYFKCDQEGNDISTYGPGLFRRRFRTSRPLFVRLVDGVVSVDDFFTQRRDATGKLGASAIQKCTAAMRMLSYGVAADSVDEYVRLSETTSSLALEHFCKAVIKKFGPEYLRQTTEEDIRRILTDSETNESKNHLTISTRQWI